MSKICFVILLYSCCSYGQITTEPSYDMPNGYGNPEQDTSCSEENNEEEEPEKRSKIIQKIHLGVKAGAGLIGGYPEQEERYILGPMAGASAYYQFTKRSAASLDVIYSKNVFLITSYRWMYENLFVKIGTYYTDAFVHRFDRALNFDKGLQCSFGCQINQMQWKPFMELQIAGLNIHSPRSHIFIMSGGVMF